MQNDPKHEDPTPNPVDDLRSGFGLLLRAAKTAASQLPKSKLETAVLSSAREFGRAMEGVAQSIENQLFGSRRDPKSGEKADPARGSSDETRKADEADKAARGDGPR